MNKLKVGDRVRHVPYGNGIVKAIDVGEPSFYFIEFDKPNERLHKGGYRGIYGKDNSCYWLHKGDLTVIAKPFKGDK